MSKKPDYSSNNIPLLTAYCNKNGLLFNWKNESQGHAVIFNENTEAYVWVQRMVVGVRKRGGIELSKTIYNSPDNYQFSKKLLDHLLFNGVKQTSHTTSQGIRVTRIPAGKTNG